MEIQKKGNASTARRDQIIEKQQRAKAIWTRQNFFSVEPNEKPKYFLTFPYPYMNGLLHLGHAFSMTKCDFVAWYKRLCGFNVLFPFGFHCTGMPICAAANKLTYELQQYGNPPKFPENEPASSFQYNLLKMMYIEQKQIPKFKDPKYWVSYFPQLGRNHVNKFGLHLDNSRSFITTDLNPYYNSFIEWQFVKLKEKGYIKFGKRPSIYSPKDKQLCADHDRSKGQGAGPDEYTVIKIQILELNQTMKKHLEGRKVYLVAATLRPQTMYGQTCCYIYPKGQYCAVQMKNDEVFICSQRSARNMAYQNLTKDDQKVQIICKFKGSQMMGLPLKAPLAVHQVIYSVPMLSISMDKGTGIVTSVPSDSPDDWITVKDLQNDQNLRAKYGITEKMINLQIIDVINTPTYGNRAAEVLCEKFKIKNQHDRNLLDNAKEESYKKGFHQGVMIIGTHKGMRVSQAKNLVKNQLIDLKLAFKYYEPSEQVISRTGDVCVVSYCEQWYINYANQQWQKKVMQYVKQQFKCNSSNLHNELIYTINWLKQWGCSRSFGLGTRLPFDKQYVIQSLSDSTIYFAFYTVSHLLQGDLDGSKVGSLGIKPDDLTLDLWDYVFLGKEYNSNKVQKYKLDKLRQSFLYWYPMDLRCSAKDLIKNHLTMALYNHAAIWDDKNFWPKAYYCNGYIQVQCQKMSKSAGNFINLIDAIKQYGADASRLTCAQSGDSINDANFTKSNANSAIIQLSTFEMFMKKSLQNKKKYRTKEQASQYAYFDQIFDNQLQNQISKVKQAYQKMIFRDVVKFGLHDFTALKDSYLLNCKNDPRKDLIQRYIYYQLLFIYPICPHFCETSYIDYFLCFVENSSQHPHLLGLCRFPQVKNGIKMNMIKEHKYIRHFLGQLRENHAKACKHKKNQQGNQFTKLTIIYRQKFQEYQTNIISLLKNHIQEDVINPEWRQKVSIPNKEQKTRALKFGGFLQKQYKTSKEQCLEENLTFDQSKVLKNWVPVIKRDFNLEIQIIQVQKALHYERKNWQQNLNSITPGNPTVIFE